MALNTTNTGAISFKKLNGKAHTQQNFTLSEESIGTNVQASYTSIFAHRIEPLPVTNSGLTTLYSTDKVVERVKFQVDIIPDTEISAGRSQGYRLKLPSDYSSHPGRLYPTYGAGTYLYNGLGKLQIIPTLFGQVKPDGSTEYDPILYQTNGSTVISKYDPINWVLDCYNGILFVQDPPAGYDVSASRPGFVEAFLFVGEYLSDIINVVATGSTGTTASNVGTGVGIFKNKVGQDLRFKGLKGSSGIVISGNTNDIIITYTGTTGGGVGTITGATNGLKLSGGGRKTGLGGNLTGATTIGLGTNNLILTGTTGTLKYGSDLSSQYTSRSVVDKGFVTGITSTLLLKSIFTTYSGNTIPAYTSTTNARLLKIENVSYITGATNGLTKSGNKVKLGGNLTGNTLIDTNNKNFTIDYGTAFETGNTVLIRATVGGTVDVPYLAFRHDSGKTLSIGYSDIKLGTNVGNPSAIAAGNISIGQNVLTSLVRSGTFLGSPWYSSFKGDRNIGIGYDIATGWTATGSSNVLIGIRNGKNSAPFSSSVAIGFNAAAYIGGDATWSENTIAIGTYALSNSNFVYNNGNYGYITAMGSSAGYKTNFKDGYGSVLLGAFAGLNARMIEKYVVLIGGAGKESSLGRGNIGIGERALYRSTGGTIGDTGVGTNIFNVAVGIHAMENSGPSEKSTFVGCEAGSYKVSGLKNTGFGSWSLPNMIGNHNMGIGPYGGYMTTAITGNGNTFIGPSAGISLSNLKVNNVFVIGNPYNYTGATNGYRPTVKSNTMYIGSVGDIILTQKYTGSSKTVTFNSSGLTYGGNYSSVFTARSIPDVGFVTGLTSSNNTVNGIKITSNYTATTLSEFVGVSATTSMGVYLPSIPKPYQKITVKDIKGNAFSVNITVNGNGKLIDGSLTSLINTNYGGIQFIYNTVNWSVVGFV